MSYFKRKEKRALKAQISNDVDGAKCPSTFLNLFLEKRPIGPFLYSGPTEHKSEERKKESP